MKSVFIVTLKRRVLGAELASDFKNSHAFARKAGYKARKFMPWTACTSISLKRV